MAESAQPVLVLTPERIRAALQAIVLWMERGDPAFEWSDIQTCQAALEHCLEDHSG